MSRDLGDRLQALPPELPDVPDRVQRVRERARRRRRAQTVGVAAATAVVVAVPAALAVTLTSGHATRLRPSHPATVMADIAARCGGDGFSITPLKPAQRPAHTASQADAVASAAWREQGADRRVFAAIVRSPIAQKLGLGPTGVARTTWVVYQVTTVASARPPGAGSRGGAFSPLVAGTRIAEVKFVDDATMKPAGGASCAPISATLGDIGFGIPDGSRVAATGQIVAAGAGYVLCHLAGVIFEAGPTCADQVALAGPTNELSPWVGKWQSRDVSGVWQHDTLQVTSIRAPVNVVPEPTWTTPPCPVPADGWATVAPSKTPNLDSTALERYLAGHKGVVTSTVFFRPARLAVVLTLASTDATATRAALQPAYPRALCVVRSRYTVAEVHAATRAGRAAIADHARLGVYSVGPGADADAQPTEDVEALTDRPELRRALAAVPAGMLRIYPWVRPLS